MTNPLYDTSLSVNERAKYIVSQLTLEEKFMMFAGHREVKRLNLPDYRFGGEAAHGLQARSGQGEPFPPTNSTSFTQPIGMAQSFDKDLIKAAGDVTGKEARAFYNMQNKQYGSTRWAPTVDLCRDPRWGRNEEGYGEDPYLTGKMAGSYVEGMQAEYNYDGSELKAGQRGDRIRIGANLKHFYANNVEWRRCYDSFEISDKVKHDYELESFRYCIEESHAEGLMTAYNGINGVTGMINPEVQNICKDKWGMKHAVCDGGAFQQVVNFHHDFETHAETLAASVKAGVDNMLDNPEAVTKAAKEAYERGLISEEEIDKSLICMFESRIRLGAFDDKSPFDDLGEKDLGTMEANDIALKMQTESVVLLKNSDSFLPLSADDDIAVVGPYADVWYQDWYGGNPMYKSTLKDGIEKVTNKKVKICDGLNEIRIKAGDKYIGARADEGEMPYLVLVDSVDDALIFRHTNWGSGCNYLYSVKYKKYVKIAFDGLLVLENETPFSWYIMENLTFVPARGANKLDNPQNANMVEFDKYYDDTEDDINIYGFGARPVYIEDGVVRGADLSEINKIQGNKEGQNMADKYNNSSMEPAIFTVEIIKNGIEEAKKLASSASKVIVALGCNPVINAKEEIDRKSIAMIPSQEKLFDEVMKANENAGVVLFTNYPYDLRNINEKARFIAMSATGSQEMGYGMARVLFGINNPAGRVSMTWYLSDDDLPDINDYDLINNPRTYRYFDGEVLYPFGYGLSYSEFRYSDINVEKSGEAKEPGMEEHNINTNDALLKVSLSITNTSNVAGDEVCQVYIKRVSDSETVHPLRRLIGFERIHDVGAGGTKEVSFTINSSDIAIYNEKQGKKVVESGEYMIYAGKNSLDEAVCSAVLL